MTEPNKNGWADKGWDVVICGGGLAGLLLARQLRQELPQFSVMVIERTSRPLPDACHKVGESSVELASQYLERLGLRDYLLDQQLVKLGLRFFPGGGHQPLVERTEIGPCAEPVVRSYQLDRGRLEQDLRGFIEEDGATLVEGAKVTNVDLSDDDSDHQITFEREGQTTTVRAHWVVDASGRTALLRKKLKLTRSSHHVASAGWFRVPGRVDVNDMVPATELEWHSRPCAAERWRSTNHFMGPGYWAWLIPLSTGHTSVGLVIHEETHDFNCIAGLDNVMAFIKEHEPHLADLLEGVEVKDFLCLRKYSHNLGRSWSDQRWAMVGEAGAFVDPLYSPGSDFIALANCFTVAMLRTEMAGEDLKAKATQLNAHYRAIFSAAVNLFRTAAPVYGHPSAMATKVFWDNLSYWSFTCHFFQQDLCLLDQDQYQPFTNVGMRFLELGIHMQKLLRAWAELAPEPQNPTFIGAPNFPSVLIDAHIKTGEKMAHDDLLEYMRMRLGQVEELAAEIVLRVIQELGPERGQELLDRAEFRNWGIEIDPERLEIEALKGHARRVKMSTVARDLERTVGRVRPHAQADLARDLLAARATS